MRTTLPLLLLLPLLLVLHIPVLLLLILVLLLQLLPLLIPVLLLLLDFQILRRLCKNIGWSSLLYNGNLRLVVSWVGPAPDMWYLDDLGREIWDWDGQESAVLQDPSSREAGVVQSR